MTKIDDGGAAGTALIYEYLSPNENKPTHIWTLVGDLGAIHIWARENDAEFFERFGERFVGGVEKHSPVPMDYSDPEQPSHDTCWLLGRPCWHDGSSLYFSERIAPMLRIENGEPTEGSHEYVRSELHDWYRSHFGGAA